MLKIKNQVRADVTGINRLSQIRAISGNTVSNNYTFNLLNKTEKAQRIGSFEPETGFII